MHVTKNANEILLGFYSAFHIVDGAKESSKYNLKKSQLLNSVIIVYGFSFYSIANRQIQKENCVKLKDHGSA